jgi:acyl-CoA thioesterase
MYLSLMISIPNSKQKIRFSNVQHKLPITGKELMLSSLNASPASRANKNCFFMERAEQIMQQMMERDLFSQWLNIQVVATGEGTCHLRMVVRKEMCNGFGIAHGGITYSLADSALAFASNSRGRHALSIETSISHLRALKPGNEIEAIAKELHLSYRTGLYEVVVKSAGEMVALFKGTVYRKENEWRVDE